MSDRKDASNEWSVYWSGRNAADTGEAFGRPGIENMPGLVEFWRAALEPSDRNARVVDFACGAGSVVRHAHELEFSNLAGVDISPDAIALMQGRYSGVEGVVSPIETLPETVTDIDFAVSQFGIEYAGLNAAVRTVATRLKPGGRFLALVHMSEGAIASECVRALEGCWAFSETGFIPTTIEVFEAFTEADETGQTDTPRIKDAVAGLTEPRAAMVALANSGHQLAAYTLQGAAQMFQRRRNYLPEDITGWLTGIGKENEAHGARMQGMLDAATSKEEGEALLDALIADGFDVQPLTEFRQGNPAEPIAWIIDFKRPDA